jgi:hypothetical protein
MTTAHRRGAVARIIRGVRRRIRLRSVLKAIALSLLIVGVAVAVLVATDLVVPLPVGARRSLRWLPALLLLPPLVQLIRLWARLDEQRIALLIDERGGLGNVISTSRTPNAEGPVAEAFRERAISSVAAIDIRRVVPFDIGRLWTGAVAATVLATAALVGSGGPDALASRWWTASEDAAPRATSSPSPAAPDPEALATLGSLGFVVRAPAYANLPTVRGTGGQTVSALPGSVVEITGDGTARAPILTGLVVGGVPLEVRANGDGWGAEWHVGTEDRGVALTVAGASGVLEQQVIPLRLLRDRPPSVELTAPSSDLVLATPTGQIEITATAADDYGVADLVLHWVRSSGSGESFDFAEGEWDWDRWEPTTDGRTATLVLSLDDLGLGAGDVLHVRATATDGNSVTGPGLGVSATRQIRISRLGDLSDITTLIGFPIEREREPLLSQRMIILLTEELRDSSASMTADEFTEASRDIAIEQARLRARIGEQIFSRATGAVQDPEAHLDFEDGEAEVFLDELEGLVERGPLIDPVTGIASIANVDIPAHEHDSDPIVAINRSLLTVYNYMWDAERDLQAARLDPSLVPQRLALEELQRVRDSERIFARGRVTVAPIDVPASRGTGNVDDAFPSARSNALPAPSVEGQVVVAVNAMLASTNVATGRPASIAISGLALDLLGGGAATEVSEALVQTAARAEAGDTEGTRTGLHRVLRMLRSSAPQVRAAPTRGPSTWAGARYLDGLQSTATVAVTRTPTSDATAVPFVFATVRYESGDWDSAPLVPNNLIHSLAQYTDLEVVPEGVVVDLASPRIFDHPFLYLTGHLPVFFNSAESQNLVDFVERGGFLFVDDHNHDIDGAFHRSVTSELQRIFGSDRWRAIPKDHELYSSFFTFDDGPPITGHELSGWGDGLIHRELFGITVDDRIGVLYSNKDYSSEWSYHSDNKRFLAVDNTRFGVNILIYALTR